MATVEEKYLHQRLQKVERTNDIIINTLQNNSLLSLTPNIVYTYQNLCFLHGQDEYNVGGLSSEQIVNLINNTRYDYYDPKVAGLLPTPLYFTVDGKGKYQLYYDGESTELLYTHGEPCLIQINDFSACYELYVDKGGALIFNFHYNLPLDLEKHLILTYGKSDNAPNPQLLMWFANGWYPITLTISPAHDKGEVINPGDTITEQGFIECLECDDQYMDVVYYGPHGVIEFTYESQEEADEISSSYNLVLNTNWDHYVNPHFSTNTPDDDDSGDDTEVGYSIKYKLCPPQEEEPADFPPASWPTHKTQNGAWDFMNELTDTYYTVIGAGGACAINDLNQIADVWGDITIYAYDDPKL